MKKRWKRQHWLRPHSKHANKRLAQLLIQHKLNEFRDETEAKQRAVRNRVHKEV